MPDAWKRSSSQISPWQLSKEGDRARHSWKGARVSRYAEKGGGREGLRDGKKRDVELASPTQGWVKEDRWADPIEKGNPQRNRAT